ncbi:MAG: hypothetical protein OXE41_08505 [Gammaproteobacteria bacterium]|nr:hypothetical protein [Gammaproteobacteria bacterium]
MFKCVVCEHADHADINTARHYIGLRDWASAREGALSLDTPLIREMIYKLA